MKRPMAVTALVLLASSVACAHCGVCGVSGAAGTPQADKDGFYPLFNGKDLAGWKISENPGSIKVKDGMIVCNGPRAHAFYAGPVGKADFKNFELVAEVKTLAKSNSGIFFHTAWQEKGWLAKGYEAQINNTHGDWRKTGGLYQIKDLRKSPAKDGEWFTYRITVKGKRVVLAVNGKVTVDWTEGPDYKPPKDRPGRKLSSGTIALQGHDPGSTVYFKSIRIKPLPD